ncbi:MAG TPA: hypothetical protein P5077_02240 [bacterium]|nr:hypothetical protein [bacterium]
MVNPLRRQEDRIKRKYEDDDACQDSAQKGQWGQAVMSKVLDSDSPACRRALQKIVEHFDRNGWPPYLDDQKFFNRASVSEMEERTGWVHVKIERHQAIMGASYMRGIGMSAFVTLLPELFC